MSRAYGVGAALVAAVAGAIGFLPLFGGPGYEQALATGLTAPAIALVCTALGARRRLESPFLSVARGGLCGLSYALLALAIAWLHLLHVPPCAPLAGSVYYAWTAGLGTVLAGLWGGMLGTLLGPRRPVWLVSVCALALPLGCIAVSLGRFWSSPMIFAFDPFVGYFSGTLYDTVIAPGEALITYRLGTLCTMLGLLAVAALLRPRQGGVRLYWRGFAARVRVLFALLALGASAANIALGTTLGHFHTQTSIRAALGGELRGRRCNIVYPAHLRGEEAALLLRDCEEQLARVERELGAAGPAQITAYFFRDADEKHRLMGAANTYIAKPWRQEVYLQLAAYPHPVLAHELAHAVAGAFGRGPFRIAGSLGGWLPNPGLIEGIAVAAAPDDDDLSELQWARAMHDLRLLPDVQALFSLQFLGQSSSRSYTVAGAFVLYIKHTFGVSQVRAWYAGGNIEALTGKSWAELSAAFVAHLETVEFPPAALELARARFGRPSVFGRHCPHVLDAQRGQADACRDRGEFSAADDHYLALRRAEPADASAALAYATSLLRQRKLAQAQQVLAPLAASTAQGPIGDRARELLADRDVLDFEFAAAASRYAELAAHSLDEDTARAYEVKLHAVRTQIALAATQSTAARTQPAAFTLLVSAGPGRSGDANLGFLELAAAAETDVIASYLIARNLVQRGEYARARPYLLRAEQVAEAPAGALADAPRIRRELVRLLAVAGTALGDDDLRSRAFAQLGPGGPFAGTAGGRRTAILALLARPSL